MYNEIIPQPSLTPRLHVWPIPVGCTVVFLYHGGFKPLSHYPKIISKVPFERKPPYLSDYTIKSNWKCHTKPTRRFFEFQCLGPRFESCDMQSFLSPRNRGFKRFLLKNKPQIRFPRPQITHFYSLFLDLSLFYKPFSECLIFRSTLYTFPDTPCTWDHVRSNCH